MPAIISTQEPLCMHLLVRGCWRRRLRCLALLGWGAARLQPLPSCWVAHPSKLGERAATTSDSSSALELQKVKELQPSSLPAPQCLPPPFSVKVSRST